MIVYKCFELHTHTLHSDGDFTLAELRERAGDFLYDAIAVTDHNTMSALDGLSPNPAEGVPVIPGIEWTTYYGHMVVLGAEEYIDWRFARPETIDEYTRAIKNVRGVIGIAHPFEFGSPLCTGCYWDFKVRDWENIDYIEVWSNPFPHGKLKNHLAFDWWTGLLNQGHRLAAAAGWDWHGTEEKPLPPATWLGLRDGRIDTAAVREALEAGRSFVTLGPFAGISLTGEDGQSYGLGETAAAGNYRLNIRVDENRRREIWAPFGIATKTIRLVQGENVIESLSYSPGQAIPAVDLRLQPGWLRLEGYGDYPGATDKLLFFSSPVYIA